MIFSEAIEWTIEACKKYKISYSFPDNSGQILQIQKNSQSHFYIHQTTPINSQSSCRLAEDKFFCYNVLHKNKICTPKTMGFLDPFVEEKYQNFRDYKSLKKIISTVEDGFSYPIICKKNSGSQGKNVFLCSNKNELSTAFKTIYDKKSADYDYFAIVQAYIKPLQEIRLIMLDGKVQFAYQKNIQNAQFVGNLSPLHWLNSEAILLDLKEAKQKFKKLSQDLYVATNIRFCGVDIIEDEKGVFWLIEVNCKPGFSHFIKDNGTDLVKNLYEEILKIV